METLPAHSMQWTSAEAASNELTSGSVLCLLDLQIQSNVSPVVALSCLSYEISLVFGWGLAVLYIILAHAVFVLSSFWGEGRETRDDVVKWCPCSVL